MTWTLLVVVVAFAQCSLGDRHECSVSRENVPMTMKAELLANEVRRWAPPEKPTPPEKPESHQDTQIPEHSHEADSLAEGKSEIMVLGDPMQGGVVRPHTGAKLPLLAVHNAGMSIDGSIMASSSLSNKHAGVGDEQRHQELLDVDTFKRELKEELIEELRKEFKQGLQNLLEKPQALLEKRMELKQGLKEEFRKELKEKPQRLVEKPKEELKEELKGELKNELKEELEALEMALAKEVRHKSSSKAVATREGSSKDDASVSGVCCCKESFCFGSGGVEHVLGSMVYCCKEVSLWCDTFTGDFKLAVANIHQNTQYTPVPVSDPCKTPPSYSRCPVSKTPSVCQPFAPEGPKFNDVEQGDLGNCYFLAPLIAIAEIYPGIIKDMFIDPNCQSGKVPVYRTRWYPDGVETFVAVDVQVPYDMHKQKPYFASSRMGVWPIILEKSWAKLFGSYMSSEGGDPAEVMRAITGAPTETWEHDDVTSDDLWQKMVSAEHNFFPMVASSRKSTGSGVAANHAFAVRGVMVGKDKTVHLQQPWGTYRYKGGQTQYKGVMQDPGSFFMTWDEYRNDMTATSAALVRPGYVLSLLVFPGVGTEIRFALQFKIINNKPFFIQLEWTRKRLFDEGCEYESQDLNEFGISQDGVAMKKNQVQVEYETSAIRFSMQTSTFTGTWKASGTFAARGGPNSQLAVVVYAAEHVKIAKGIKIINATDHCLLYVERLGELDNVEDIMNGEDSKFPPVLTSIGGGLMGDTAQNIANNAESYNTWKKLTETEFCK